MDTLRYKIAYILTPIEIGGSESVNLSFLENVDRKTFDVYPILFIRPWETDNIFVENVKKMNYSYYTLPVALRPRINGRDYMRIFRAYRLMYSILSNNYFDLIHTHGYLADIVSIPIAKSLGIPTVSTCHGYISTDRKLKIYNFLDQKVLRVCNKIIAVSEEIKTELITSGIRDLHISVIQNSVPLKFSCVDNWDKHHANRQMLGFKEIDFVIGYVGRLSTEKGLDCLLKASAMLARLGISIKVLLIGQGCQRNNLENLARQIGISERVLFAGFQKDVENWLPAFDVFVLPSLTEGTPIAMLEAMASGIPVVASRVGGIPNVVQTGKNGLLVSPGNIEELTEALLLLINNPSARKAMAERARSLIKLRFDIKKWTTEVENEYRLAVSLEDRT